LPFAVCRLPFAVCRLPFAICRLPFAVCGLPFVVCHLPFAICRLPFAHLGLGHPIEQQKIKIERGMGPQPNVTTVWSESEDTAIK
jgi:hypothetical protein